jgi:hypothetical protein
MEVEQPAGEPELAGRAKDSHMWVYLYKFTEGRKSQYIEPRQRVHMSCWGVRACLQVCFVFHFCFLQNKAELKIKI